jgi:hypothetical protein
MRTTRPQAVWQSDLVNQLERAQSAVQFLAGFDDLRGNVDDFPALGPRMAPQSRISIDAREAQPLHQHTNSC